MTATRGTPQTSSSGSRAAAPRFVFVDFLRGAAALLVAYFHLQIHCVWHFPSKPIAPDSFTYRFVFGNFGLGIYGVALFFMISGFLIPSTLRGSGSVNALIRRFAIHRFFRLYPLYWLSMAGAMLAAYLVSGAFFPLRQILANATMLQGYVGQADMVGVYWTLQIELTFYVVCVVLLRLRSLDRSEAILGGFLALSLACAAARFWLGRKLPVALFLGPAVMFLGDMVRRAPNDATLRKRLPFYVALVLVVLLPTCLLAYGAQWRCYVLSYAAAIGSFLLAHRFANAFETGALRGLSVWLGETSYAVYLFHGLVAARATELLIARGVEKELSVALGLALCLALSSLLHKALEQPFIALGRKLATRQDAPRIARPAATDGSP